MTEQWIQHLDDGSVASRRRAILKLADQYDCRVGKALVKCLSTESDDDTQVLLISSIFPTWIPLFDNKMVTSRAWHLTSRATVAAFNRSCSCKLYSFERHLSEWKHTGNLVFQFVSSAYRLEHQDMSVAREDLLGIMYRLEDENQVSSCIDGVEVSRLKGFVASYLERYR